MYFPKIRRRTAYKVKKDGAAYLTYSAYYDEIAEDCQNRCVYCDVLVVEVGGESMNLDHFRPEKHFPELHAEPTNLVLSCPKCNQLKSDWWPEKQGTADGGKNGFVDPFSEHMLSYVKVDDSGFMTALRNPSQYMIDLMLLNRPTRQQIRRARKIRADTLSLMKTICDEIDAMDSYPVDHVRLRLPVISKALTDIRVILEKL